ncbi:MAG: hypothetical protein ACK48X_17970, partial [Planctomycetota bacterium]
AETQVLDKRPTGRRSGKVAWLIKVVNQRSEVVQQGVFETLVATRLREGKSAQKSSGAGSTEPAVKNDPSAPQS